MITLFRNILLLKQFLARNGCCGLFTKVKKGTGTSFWCTFSTRIFHKNVPYLTLYLWTKFQCHTFFSFSKCHTKYVIKFLFRQLMMWQTIRFIFYHFLKQWPTWRKRGEDGNTEIWISWEQKEFFRWNKNHFS